MKGLILSSFYASKTSHNLFNYWSHIKYCVCVFSPMMCCFMLMVMLLSPVADNLKREKILNGCTMYLPSLHIEILM